MSRFLPPANLAMTTLNRLLFHKTFPMTAAHVFDEKNIGRALKGCKEDLLRSGNLTVDVVVREDDSEGRKRVLVRMRPTVRHDGMFYSRCVVFYLFSLSLSRTNS